MRDSTTADCEIATVLNPERSFLMLQSLQQRFGEKLRASDGEIGHVRDFYFDDKSWNVRYLVADTDAAADRGQPLNRSAQAGVSPA